MNNKESMEKLAADRAHRRDAQLRRIEETAAAHRASAEEEFHERLNQIEAQRKRDSVRVFEDMERALEAHENFLNSRADAAKIKAFGLDLPFIHPTKTFGRVTATAYERSIRIAKAEART